MAPQGYGPQNVKLAGISAVGREHRHGGAVWPSLKWVRYLGGDGGQGQQRGAWMTAAQDGAGYRLLFIQHGPILRKEDVGWQFAMNDARVNLKNIHSLRVYGY